MTAENFVRHIMANWALSWKAETEYYMEKYYQVINHITLLGHSNNHTLSNKISYVLREVMEVARQKGHEAGLA